MHCQGLFRFSFGFRCPPLFGNSLLPTSLFWSLRPIPSRGLSPRRPGIPLDDFRSPSFVKSWIYRLKHSRLRSVAPCRRQCRKQNREERRESHEKSECAKGNGENSTPPPDLQKLLQPNLAIRVAAIRQPIAPTSKWSKR